MSSKAGIFFAKAEKLNIKNKRNDILKYLSIIITSVVALIVLLLLTKLGGNKQLSELNMFDYIISITIGSIAAEMATELENPEEPLIALIIFGLAAPIISVISAKSIRMRRLIMGKAIVLMHNGKLFRDNFKKCKLDLSEFLMQARINGYFDLSAVNTAVMEPGGRISFLPYPDQRPVTPKDISVTPPKESLCFNIIMDGRILEKNLKTSGRDLNWLNSELKKQNAPDIKNIFLASVDENGTLNFYGADDIFNNGDLFE